MLFAPLNLSNEDGMERRGLVESTAVFLIAGAWLFYLATWTGFRVGKPVYTRDNLVFDMDVPTVAQTLLHEADPQFKSRHRLGRPIWGPVGAALKSLSSPLVGPENARSVAARLLMAFWGGIGFASLWHLARGRGLPLSVRLLLFASYAVFTSQILCSVPEFYGISAGILSLSFAIYCSRLNLLWKAAILSTLTIIGSGTTTTVGAVPAACLALSIIFAYLPPETARKWVLSAIVAGTCLVVIGVGILAIGPYRNSIRDTIDGKGVGIGTHYRLLRNPEIVPGFVLRGLIHPAVGTHPEIFDGPTKRPTFNNSIWNQADKLALAGQVAWVVLLVWGTIASLGSGFQNFESLLLIGWIAGNLALHNIWGNEFFLYSPHWSWALFSLVILGAGRIPAVVLWSAGIVMIAGGISEILTIEELLRSLS